MIRALVLAAGQSKRMGQPKMLLPWGKSTVLQTVISTIQSAGLTDILVVTGGSHREVEALIGSGVQTIYNGDHLNSDMLGSIQTGLRAGLSEADALLICLGDQPQIKEESVRRVCDAFLVSGSPIVVPSYQMHRGHPWLLAHPLWEEFNRLRPPQTPRDFLMAHAAQINHVPMDTASILEDLDTPQDYLKSRSSK